MTTRPEILRARHVNEQAHAALAHARQEVAQFAAEIARLSAEPDARALARLQERIDVVRAEMAALHDQLARSEQVMGSVIDEQLDVLAALVRAKEDVR